MVSSSCAGLVDLSELTVRARFTTGEKINYLSSLMHEAYQAQTENPVLLTVDTSLTNFRLGVKAYVGKTIKVNEKPVIARFECASLEYFAYEEEKIGGEHQFSCSRQRVIGVF